jgi:4-amino-4-deoxy-L-arabinose transferase-like glycosyltransferase
VPRYRLLAAFLLVAALLRLPSPYGISAYTPVELERDLAVARQMRDGVLPRTGPKSIQGDFRFGPAYYYLIYPFAAAGGFAPSSTAVASMFFSVLTVAAIFFVALAWWKDRRIAYLTAAMATISFLDITFALYASNPNLVPFFALGFFFCLERLLRPPARTERRRALIAAGLGASYGVAAQLHAVPLTALPLAALALAAAGRLRLSGREWFAALVGAAIVSLPVIAYQLGSGFADVRGLAEIATGQADYGDMGSRWAEYFTYWFSLWISLHHLFNVVDIAGLGIMVPVAASIALVLAALLIDRRRRAGPAVAWTPSLKAAVLAWLAAPTVVLLAPFGKVSQLFIYYFTVFTPLAFLLAGYGLHRLWRTGRRATFWSVLATYVIWQAEQYWLYSLAVA